ncbi:hypothetical protein AWC38_SpisGene16843 [Stylophora pistillata]|uniref:FP protein C-terminal domain-containing protein n=1 Tax=Stylophora pistillata TaxID=50429 RepID=A0A2B4RRA5_STYPI|nr:hypothetical protein AWC38_SpisGene16843 [Stylophora pistillata]
MLEKTFEDFQNSLKPSVNDANVSSNGGEASRPAISQDETLNTLQFYAPAFYEVTRSMKPLLQQLWSLLNVLCKRVEEIGKSIELIQRYSYQYNVKIVGLPEIKASESASDTTTLCLSLFQAAGVEILIQDIDIAHRIPTRNATPGPSPVVCKFTRRIANEKVMNVRKDAYKVTASSTGLPADCTLENVKLFDHLTEQVQQLLADTKKFQTRNGFKFCWCKNVIIYLRQTEDSRPIKLKTLDDLERFARQENLPLS